MPASVRFTNDLSLVAKCHDLWELNERREIPDIRKVAEMDMDYFDDLMLYDQWVSWAKGKNKGGK
jgi:hypothetical protein